MDSSTFHRGAICWRSKTTILSWNKIRVYIESESPRREITEMPPLDLPMKEKTEFEGTNNEALVSMMNKYACRFLQTPHIDSNNCSANGTEKKRRKTLIFIHNICRVQHNRELDLYTPYCFITSFATTPIFVFYSSTFYQQI